MASKSKALASVYSGFKSHNSALRTNTDLAIIEIIRAVHPDSEVISLSLHRCDLESYAGAGLATSFFKADGGNTLVERAYRAPISRLNGGDGELGDDVSFGFYEYEFQGHKFDIYRTQYSDEAEGTQYHWRILAPKQDLDAAGHSTKVDHLICTVGKWTSQLHDELYVFDSGCWQKSKKLWSAVQSSSWDDVILDPAMKQTIISDVENFFDSQALYEEFSVPWKRGVILHGTPGCGKTISIKALVNTLGKRDIPVASLYVKTLANCNGLHYAIRSIFAHARSMAPCLLIFEDLDSLVVDEVRSDFLNEVDGLEDNNGILMIGSTNHLERLDAGISKRPSRFDRKYEFKIPGHRERVLYCEYWKQKLERANRVDFDPVICDVVAKLTDGFSFAYLKELFVQTLLSIVGGRHLNVDDENIETQSSASSDTAGSDSGKVGNGYEIVSNPVVVTDEAEANKREAEATKSLRRSMPLVEIPDSVKDNPLMRTLHKQAALLWKEMDNTSDDKKATAKTNEE